MARFTGLAELRQASGEELGASEWFTVTQDVIDAFADATGDHQFIHVDAERAKATPFGTTIAHGLLTLSLGPRLMADVLKVDGVDMGVNYGYDRVRFTAPVPSGSRLRVRASLESVTEVSGGVQLTVKQTFEVDGSEKPACVADSVVRFYGNVDS